jgi:hypothetical protein
MDLCLRERGLDFSMKLLGIYFCYQLQVIKWTEDCISYGRADTGFECQLADNPGTGTK